MNCSGIDAITGRAVSVKFGETIATVTEIPRQEGMPWLAPGYIDLQVNGFAGVDYNDPRTAHEEIARSIRALFDTGVTRFYPTVITGAPAEMAAALRNLSEARDRLEHGEAIEGFHVEGPHISPEDGPRGAHPRQWVRPPDLDEFRRWQEATQGTVRIVTVSPEWPQAPRYIERIVSEGVVAAIGHTQADAGQIQAAVSAGATLSTHLGNGAHPVLRRHPNYIWEQLAEDRLMADFIVDGIHIDASFLKVALRAKGIARSILITDAVTPAGAPPGPYRLGEQAVEHTADGRVVLAGTDRLAGSALRMDRGVANLIRLAGIPFSDAIRMATVNPARAGQIRERRNGLLPGDRGDILELRPDLTVARAWISGRSVVSPTAPV